MLPRGWACSTTFASITTMLPWRVCKEEDGVLWSKIFYKHIEEVSSDISPKVVKLQWHSYHVANSNDISLNCDTCNDIHLVTQKMIAWCIDNATCLAKPRSKELSVDCYICPSATKCTNEAPEGWSIRSTLVALCGPKDSIILVWSPTYTSFTFHVPRRICSC
jgi:hypothetical protein